ncbi:MAG: putative dsRNA-binding protein, partial [Candidatus Hodarchaeales archaeon]
VQNEMLYRIGDKIKVQNLLLCAPGYKVSNKDLADAVEAIFGAKYLEGGLKSCQLIFRVLFEKNLSRILVDEEKGIQKWGRNEYNPKNILNEYYQERNLPLPVYKFQKREGTDHDPIFWFSCEGLYQETIITGIGSGKSKKDAQKIAAIDLLKKIKNLEVKENESP